MNPSKPKWKGPGEPSKGKTVRLTTLCFGCGVRVECDWPAEMSYAGLSVTPQEYMALALNNDKTEVLCDACIQKRPDVRVEDLIQEDE